MPESPENQGKEAVRDPAGLLPDARTGAVGSVLGRGPTPLAMLALAAVGLLVFWPSIASPLLLDDYLHRAMANHVFPSPRSPLDLYDFVSDRDRDLLIARGVLPWWTDPSLEIRFFRPLSSLILYADHRALGAHPLAMHLHSYAWWLACVLAARSLFLRLFSPRVTLLGTVIFALAPCHAVPLAWIANREALISLTFGLLALGHYEDLRAAPRPLRALTATALFGLSLAAGEYGLLLSGYVVALELSRAPEPLGRRALGLLPWLAPTLAYLALRRALGYGTAGSGLYSDPTRDAGDFLMNAPRRFVTLVFDGWLSLDGETMRGFTPWGLALGTLGLLAIVGPPVYGAISRLEDATAARAKAMLLGSALSLLPALAVRASPRLVGASLVGVAAVIALVMDDAWFAPPAPVGALESAHAPRGAQTALVAYALGFLHFVHSPTTSWVAGKQVALGARTFAVHARSLGRRAPEGAEVHLVRSPSAVFFLPFALNDRGAPPKRWRVLSRAGHVLGLRDDAQTLTLAVAPDASLFATEDGSLFRTASIRAGQVFKTEGMQVEVLEVGSEGPRRARFTFDKPLEDVEMAWFTETLKGYPAAELPPPGFGAPFDP